MALARLLSRARRLVSAKLTQVEGWVNEHEAAMDQVERRIIRPLALHIIDFELHIWWNPSLLASPLSLDDFDL